VIRLQDKIVLVTGGARGLGRAIARRCAQEGAAVALIDILETDGKATAADLRQAGAQADFWHCDITDSTSLQIAIDAIGARWGRLDGLVNNAALATKLAGRGFDAIDEDTWDRVFRINVKGTWMVTRAVAPLLRAAQQARVVNMASDTALWGGDLFLHYVASKGAIIAMTKGLAREFGADGIAVNAVAPGLIETEATSFAPERRWQQYQDGQLLKRRGSADDIAATVAFLLTTDAAHITGQTLAVNSGMTLN
jgi:NAD(P)-dependent dehydrogenase (short-subunit alcohol dehydrogenase family)